MSAPASKRAFLIEGLARHEKSLGVRHSDEEESAPDDAFPAPGELMDFPF